MADYEDINRFFPITITGLVTGVRSVLVCISFAALVFSGPLSQYLSAGISLALFSGAAISLIMALSSSYQGTVGLPHSLPAAALALAAAGLTAALTEAGSQANLLATVAAALMIACLVTGSLFLLLGLLRLGNLIRYVPYPVIGGFVAGTGWVLITGAFAVMLDTPLGFGNFLTLLRPEKLGYWLPGLAFGVILFAASKKASHFLILPTLLVGAIWVFYAGLYLLNIPLTEALHRGMMLGPFPERSEELIAFFELGPVEWPALVKVLPDLAITAVISVIALLLYASGIELAVAREIDLNQELRAAGLANIMAAFGGGFVGYHILSLTALSHRMHADSRWVGVVSAGVCAVTLGLGAWMVSYFPRAVMAGLLIFLGLDFLYEWVIRAWRKLPPAEYLIVLAILVAVAGFGFLEGLAAGFLAGLVLFVVNYSRVDVVHFSITGAQYHSNVDRSEKERRILEDNGDRILVLKLHGFLFFGTADGLLGQVRTRALDDMIPRLDYVLLDFRMVSGLDSSAVIAFTRMRHLAEKFGFLLGFAGVTPLIVEQFDYCGFSFESGGRLHLFEDLDHALETCENLILASNEAGEEPAAEPLLAILKREFPPAVDVLSFLQYLTRQKVQAGQYLMVQGAPSEELYFLETGRVTAELVLGDGRSVRLRSMGPGTVVGEIGVYVGLPRTASVRAETNGTMYRLTREAMARLEERNPAAAAALHRYMVRLLAQRLAYTDNMVKALLE
ncbi:MAG: SulP family inorganic anion transporter [Thermodesulfobacteriota bacterium]